MAKTFTPPESVQNNAKRGLELRRKHGRGGLSTQEAGEQGIGSGVARARDLASGNAVSADTIGRMVSFFARHEKNKDSKTDNGEPGAGRISWLLWGGDSGKRWAESIKKQLDKEEKAAHLDDLILVEQARDYAKEYRDYHGKPEQVESRSSRNKARRKLKKDGRVEDGDGKEVDHIDGNPKNNRPSNLRAVSRKTNRVKKSMYNQAIKLYPIARALIARAQTDAPNYRPATNLNSCGDCGHFDGEQCNLFNFAADPDYVCDKWTEQDPPIGELKALLVELVERAGARNSQADLSRIQAIHDKCVELGAMCKAESKEGEPKSVPLFGIHHE